jgi:hypothetical protein
MIFFRSASWQSSESRWALKPVHVATMDRAARPDRWFRRLFGGKVAPVPQQPESILYFFLTTPRVAAPRWYHEGIAVFVDTWMSGGLGRAQGGYDEMVFRSMVRDDTPFYDPLGLVSEGTRIDFQVEVNSYLYGTRFMTWLARRYSPEQLIDWVSRPDGSRGYYSARFAQVFGTPLGAAWTSWVADEHVFQRSNLDAIRKYPLTPYRDLTSRALGSVSRVYYDPADRRIYGAFNYPGVLSHVGAIAAELPLPAGGPGFRLRCLPREAGLAGRSSLLHGVDQFVGQQGAARLRVRTELSGSEDHVLSDRVGARIHRRRGLLGLGAGMHPHTAEILSETRLHEVARRAVERPAGRAQHVMHNRRDGLVYCRAGGTALQHRCALGRHRSGRPRHAHDLIGDALGFLLQCIARLTDCVAAGRL